MTKRITRVSFKAGLLPTLLMACQLSAYAGENTGKVIVVNLPDKPDHIVKLRPFVRNRNLPSRAQLQALQEERAQTAEQNQAQSMLNGRVSAFDNNGAAKYSSDYALSTNAVRKWARLQAPLRANPPVVNTTATQFCSPYVEKSRAPVQQSTDSDTKQGFSFLRMAEQHLSSSFSHPPDTSAGSQTQSTAAPQFSESVYPSWPPVQSNQSMTNTPLSLSVSPVSMTPSSSDTSGFGSAGPPPFPLSLLPAPALKQLIRSMAYGSVSRTGYAPPSHFGSWHNNVTFTPETPPSPSGSPLGNFRLYSNMTYASGNSRSSGAPSAVTSTHRRMAAKRKQLGRTNHPGFFSYPAYPTYSSQSVP